jgi:hypothetical protein
MMDKENDPRIESFKKELAALLNKHEASLSFMFGDCSDTYGMYDEGMGVSFLNPLKEGDRSRGWTDDHRLCDGYGISAKDIEEP